MSITASGVDDATADSTAASGGIISGDGADGTATIDPSITATTGNGSQIDAVDEVSVLASVTPKATADVTGVSAGELAVGASVASATDSPTVTAIAGGAGTTIIAATLDVGVATYLPAPMTTRARSESLDPERSVIFDQQHRHRERQRQRVGRRLVRRHRHLEHRE